MVRFIPTHVGYTPASPAPKTVPCRFIPTHVGYTSKLDYGRSIFFGSSPRMWGIRFVIIFISYNIRFIPTHVGYTAACEDLIRITFRFIPTHVGYTTLLFPLICRLTGSSPRMWGIHYGRYVIWESFTVHPHACGVYGTLHHSGGCIYPVHPHACGVYLLHCLVHGVSSRFIPTHVGYTFSFGGSGSFLSGSSPRMWGIPRVPCSKDCTIPVHPHACGVYP